MDYAEIRKYTLNFIRNNDGYYRTYFLRLLSADNKTISDSVAHWEKCHLENLDSGRNEMIIFSGKMLGAGLLAQKLLAHKKGV